MIKITAIKFETVNGKKTGKSFSFGMDPKEMAKYKTEATVRKKIEEYVSKSGIFKKEELEDLRYNMKEFLEEWRKQLPIVEEELRNHEMSNQILLPLNLSPKYDWTPLRNYSIGRWPNHLGKTHGVGHWDRVARLGNLIAEKDADLDVIIAFAYLHDVERLDNDRDEEHGIRASKSEIPI